MEATGLDIEALKKAVQDEAERLERDRGRQGKGHQEQPQVRVLGGMLELSPPLASAVSVAVNWLQPSMRRFVENSIVATATPALTRVMPANNAKKAAEMLADGAGWTMTFYDEAGGVVGDARDHFKEISQLKQRFSKANVAHGGSSNSLGALKGNELVGVEVRRAHMHLHDGLMNQAAKLISSAPQAWIKIMDRKEGSGKASSLARIKGEGDGAYKSRLATTLTSAVDGEFAVEKELNEKMKAYRQDMEHYEPWEKEEALRTIKTNLREQLKGNKNTSPAISEATTRELLVPLGALGTVVAQNALAKNKEGRDALKTTAMDMIEKLTDVVINDQDAKTVSGLSFAAYIRNIFNTHQENMGEPRIGKRFDEKLDYACKEIAKAITEGRMHPMALVSLVGERKIVKDMGKHIASRDEVAAAIEEQITLLPAKFSVDAEEYLTEAAVTEQDLKHSVEALQGQDRAFLVSLLPEEVAKKIGVKEEEIRQAHQIAKDDFAQNLAKAVLDIATLSDAQLQEAKFSAKEIKLIREVAPKAEQGDMLAVMEKVGKKGAFKDTLDTTIVNAMGLGLEQHPGELFEHAGSKIYAEHAHPGGSYVDALEKEREGAGRTSHGIASHEHEAHSFSAEEDHAWDLAEEADELEEKPHHAQHKPHHVVHHAQHEGKQRAHQHGLV